MWYYIYVQSTTALTAHAIHENVKIMHWKIDRKLGITLNGL